MTAKVFGSSRSAFPAGISAGGRRSGQTQAATTLAAHQLHVLFSAGNPAHAQAHPDWRPVRATPITTR